MCDSLVGEDALGHVLIDDQFFEDVGVALDGSSSGEVGGEGGIVFV